MQNKALVLLNVLYLGALLIFNSGCNGVQPSENTLASLVVPINGACGATIDRCSKGDFKTETDSATHYLWTCKGIAGGADASCSVAIPVVPGTSDGTVADEDRYFYVGIESEGGFISNVHKDTGDNVLDFSAPCAIDKTSGTNEDINCIVDAPEGDIFARDLPLKFNVPPGMCKYLRRKTYWFYNYETGYGPTEIVLTINNQSVLNASGDPTGEIKLASYDCTVVDSVNGNHTCATDSEVYLAEISSAGGSMNCRYNETGSNCCLGGYNFSLTINLDGSFDSGSSTPTSWGGNMGSCIGGAGRTDWSAASSDGVPLPIISNAGEGLRETYTVTPPLKLNMASGRANIHSANYYGGSITHTNPDGNPGTVPYFMKPYVDRTGDSLAKTQETYEFQCLDEAFEVLQRIRVKVRDWDTYYDFLQYVATKGSSFNPDRAPDAEPTLPHCNGLPGLGEECDDFFDIDDFLRIDLSGSYSPSNTANRSKNFPALDYQ